MLDVLSVINSLPSYFMEIALILNIRIWSCYYIRIGAKSTNPLRWSGAFSEFINKYLPEYDKKLDKKVKNMH